MVFSRLVFIPNDQEMDEHSTCDEARCSLPLTVLFFHPLFGLCHWLVIEKRGGLKKESPDSDVGTRFFPS